MQKLQINVSACEWQVLLCSEFSMKRLSFFFFSIGLIDTCYPMACVPARERSLPDVFWRTGHKASRG